MGGAKRDGGLLSAARAGGLGFDLGVALVLTGRGGGAEDGDPLGFASLATLGLVLKLFVVEEQLLPGGENKITATVDTLQHLVLKIHLRMAPFSLFTRATRGEMRWIAEKTGCVLLPLFTAPWTRPATQPGWAWVLTIVLSMPEE